MYVVTIVSGLYGELDTYNSKEAWVTLIHIVTTQGFVFKIEQLFCLIL